MSRLGKRNIRWWIAVFAVVFAVIIGIAAFFLMRMRGERADFGWKESSRTLVNPARGMYMQLYHNDTPDWMAKMVKNGRPLCLITMDLQRYTKRKIPDKELGLLEDLLKAARQEGVMIFFRGSYKQKEGMPEPTLDLIHEHIGQISALLNSYSDVVLMVQAGMIGLWGEWHTSDYLRDEEAVINEAGKVVQWWLEELDTKILLNLRRPSYIRLMEKAGLDASRIGFHDDGLLGSGSDLGTYPDRQQELKWCRENINGRFNGGEMPYVNDLTEPANVLREFDELSLSYLNYFYNTEVLDDWRTREYYGENAYDYIERHIGYRYYVKNANVPRYIFEDQRRLHLSFELGNTGFSSIVSRFRPYLVVEQGEKRQFIPVSDRLREKGLERYEADVELADYAPVRLGVCYTDAKDPAREVSGEEGPAAHCVEMAGEGNIYKSGVNYFLKYSPDPRTGHFMRAGRCDGET